jgi:hypothetical protein
VVGGAVLAVAADTAGAPLGVAAGIGGAAAICSGLGCLAWQRTAHTEARNRTEALFPSTGVP